VDSCGATPRPERVAFFFFFFFFVFLFYFIAIVSLLAGDGYDNETTNAQSAHAPSIRFVKQSLIMFHVPIP